MTRPATIIFAAVLLGACGGPTLPVQDWPQGVLHIQTDSAEVQIDVSIAETEATRQRGLMGIEEMDEDVGMVFLEPEPVKQRFWMKDTLIPLSIAFWDEGGKIIAILDMEPCREDPCDLYGTDRSWVGAVEVNQGFFGERGVEVGDTLTLER